MFLEISLTALGLSMDACAASIAASSKFRSWPRLVALAFLFGFFQAAMPLLGYLFGLPFGAFIGPVDHWIAFFILAGLGLHMAFDGEKDSEALVPRSLTLKWMFSLAIATSIDAFVVGIGLHALQWPLYQSISIIGLVTLVASLFGILLGKYLKQTFAVYAEKAGGIILMLLGLKILVSHLFF